MALCFLNQLVSVSILFYHLSSLKVIVKILPSPNKIINLEENDEEHFFFTKFTYM